MKCYSFFTNYLRQQLFNSSLPLLRIAERQLNLQALHQSLVNQKRLKLNGLHDVEFSAYSQWGEDGIIDWLVERLPEIKHSFVEFWMVRQ